MSNSKKPKKVKLDSEKEKVDPPWQAWWHADKKRKFYTNSVTKESIWEHPNDQKISSKKPHRDLRKRKDVETTSNDSFDVEKMEVDAAPPPKRKTMEKLETEAISSKRPKKLSSVEIREDEKQNPSTSHDSDKVFPLVPWSSKTRPFNRIHYRACAIFDTCALIENPEVLNLSIEKQILTIVPYAVLSELDGLKNGEVTRRAANSVSNRLKDLQEERSFYLRVETSVEQQIKIDGYLPNQSIKDDSILNCALRIQKEVLSISSELSLNDRSILLVTNDTVLCNKAMTHGLIIESMNDFIDKINGREKKKKNQAATRKSNDRGYRSSHSPSEKYGNSTESFERRNKKAVAVEYVKRQRETKEWISSMTKPVTEKYATVNQKLNADASTSSYRPTIPLEDEIVSQFPTPTKTLRSYNVPKYQAYQSKKPIALEINRNRPKMPLSLSDDECPIEDEMDCS